jgi:hypothetical protein
MNSPTLFIIIVEDVFTFTFPVNLLDKLVFCAQVYLCKNLRMQEYYESVFYF